MKVVYFGNEFPHDDLHKLLRQLHQHSKNRRHPVLARFLDEATRAAKDEVACLPTTLQAQIPPFESILNWVDFAGLRRQGPLTESINGALLCLLQIATIIGYLEDFPNTEDPNLSSTVVAGLGIGLLATSVVALTRHVSDMPLVGAQAIRQAFRLGVMVYDVSATLQPHDPSEDATPESWAYVLPEVNAAEVESELKAVNSKERTPEAGKIFISALASSSVTISGPPARLQALFQHNEFFRDRRYFQLPVYGGLCHASHIYSPEHVAHVVNSQSMELLNNDPRLSSWNSVYSSSTGRPFAAKGAASLFELIIEEILTKPIQWDNVVQGMVHQAKSIEAASCDHWVFRSSLMSRELAAAFEKKAPHVQLSIKELIPWIQDGEAVKQGSEQPRGTAQSKIAIVGMSCRMPGGATNTEMFWELLENGLDVHRKIPADRFDVETHHDPTGKRQNTSHTAYGCFIDEPGLFDAPFFNMSPREAQQTDPMQRLALVTAYEALERAGYVANRTAATRLERIGTFYGQASDDYREVNTAQEISTYFIPGGCRAFGPGRINYFFKFSGPSYSIDSACSSSLATIQSACTALWNGELDTAVVGGMNVLTNSDAFAGLSHGHFLTKTPNACKTWDSEADGYCRADAVASLVMKRLEDAEADNDNILGVICSAGTNHSANAISITHPHAGHQAYLGRLLLNRAGVDPLDVGFVEMHGTGTQAGDAEEIESVTEVYAPVANGKRRSTKNPLYIGAVKSNVGHSEAAAGVTALMKVLLMMKMNAIPPHVGIKTSLNPKFPKDLDQRNVRIPYQKVDWPRPTGKKRIAVVNNFSAAGGNTSVVVEDAPLRERTKAEDGDPRSTHVIALSAKSKISLRGNIERVLKYLDCNEGNPESLKDLSYTLTARRYHHNHRVVFPASELTQVKKQLETALNSVESHKPISLQGHGSIAFTFTGQGASHKSYSLELFHHCPQFRHQVIQLDRLGQGQGFPSFLPVLDGSHSQDHQHSVIVTQLAQTCVEMALVKYWASLGVKPDVVVGHSLGEYAALNAAGVLSASDTVFLVGQRAMLIEQKCLPGSHSMVAVRAALEKIAASLSTSGVSYEVACLNGPSDTVLSGINSDMDAAIQQLEKDGYKCFKLDVPFAFHSAQTDPVLEDLEAIATSAVLFQSPQVPIISPLLDKVVFDEKSINASYMSRATREPVNMLGALKTARDIGIVDEDTTWVEIGPHPVCLGMVKNTLGAAAGKVRVASFRRGEDNWTTLAHSLSALHGAGIKIEWNEFHAPFEKSLRLLDLPTYAWNDKTYWLQYNGDWALTKGNHFYDEEKGRGAFAKVQAGEGPNTSLLQTLVEEKYTANSGTVVVQSDLSRPDFRAAAWGHKMNSCGVVTSSIHGDIAFTLGQYLYKKLRPDAPIPGINVANLEVSSGLITNQDAKTPQIIELRVHTENIDEGFATVHWYHVRDGVAAAEHFVSAVVTYDNPASWMTSWRSMKHFVESRIEDLQTQATNGEANRINGNMAYEWWAKNLVDYAGKYRGMKTVVLNGLEAYADVTLAGESSNDGHEGKFTVPPHFIDSVVHLAGFVMNVSDAIDTNAKYAVTPGWQSMKFARPLVPGSKYRSYVKMIPTEADPTHFFGDVYIMQDGEIMGMCGGIQFKLYPRILLSRFFSAPDDPKAPPIAHANSSKAPATKPHVAASSATSAAHSTSQVALAMKAVALPTPVPLTNSMALPNSADVKPKQVEAIESSTTQATPAKPAPTAVGPVDENSTTSKAIRIIATETALDLSELTDNASFAEIGVDSLMSLVIAENFREQLGVVVNGSLFLEYPTVGSLRAWLDEYYS